MKSVCPECGETYSPKGGGHCRGGAYGGCCRTFASDGAADAHRRGPYSPDGLRHCVDVTMPDFNRNGKPVVWRLTARGWTHRKEQPAELRARRGQGRRKA